MAGIQVVVVDQIEVKAVWVDKKITHAALHGKVDMADLLLIILHY
jgi:hypothetical protein